MSRNRLAFIAALIVAVPLLACSPTNGHARPQESPVATSAPAAAATPAPALQLAPGGADFSPELKLLFKVVACGGDAPVPERFDKAVLAEHCAWVEEKLAGYHKDYLDKAQPFLAKLRPAGLPTTVVYPFGGGDLLSALTTYPDATEITTLSLEYAGDPRRVDEMDSARLSHSLAQLRRRISGLLAYAESTSENLMQMQRGDIPGQLAFFLIGLRLHGCEPDGLRYFRIEPDGALHYLDQKEIAAYEAQRAQRLNKVWVAPDFSLAFANSEIVYHRRGQEGQRVHRHVAADLIEKDDPGFTGFCFCKSLIQKSDTCILKNIHADFDTVRPEFLKKFSVRTGS